MNIGESCDVMTLLRWLLGDEANEAEAKSAAIRLAQRAYKTLHAGLSGQEVERRWAEISVRATLPIGQRPVLHRPPIREPGVVWVAAAGRYPRT